MLQLHGGAALSKFRLNKLLAVAREQVSELAQISTEFVHFVDLETRLTDDEHKILEQLLTYGAAAEAATGQGQLLLVVPRPGTISPWSSKATDIAHNCGLNDIHRIERGVVYRFLANDGNSLTDHQLTQIKPLIHDRMTERVLDSLDDAEALFGTTDPKPMTTVDILVAVVMP